MIKKSKLNNKSNIKTKKNISFVFITLLTTLIPFIFYLMKNILIKICLYIIIILCIILIIIKYKHHKKLISFLKETRQEFKNITWSKRKETIQSTLAVLCIVFCTSIILWIIDSILTYIVSKII